MTAAGQSGIRNNRWGFLIATTLGRACVGFQFQALPALAPALAAGLGLSLSDVGTLTGLYMLPGVVIAILGGALLQRFAVRTVLILALTTMMLAGAVSFLASGYHGLAFGRLLGGIGGVLLIVATLKGIYDWFSESDLSFANGVSSAAHPFGMGSALLIFSAMGPHAAWQMGLLLTGVVSAVAMVAVLALTSKATRPTPGVGVASAVAIKLPPGELVLVILAGCVLALYAGSFHAFLSLFPSYLFAAGWSPGETASLMSLLGWGPIVMAPVGGLIVSRLGHTSLLIAICIFLWGGSTVALTVIGVTPWLIGVMLIFGPLVMGPVFSLGARAVSPERRGIGSGIFMSGFFLGNSMLPAAAAWVGETMPEIAGNGETTAVMFCGIAFLCALAPLSAFEAVRAKSIQSARVPR